MSNRILIMLLLACTLSACGTAMASPPGTPVPDLTVERVDGADGGKVYQVVSSGTVAAARDVAWRVLTGYDQLADVVPDLKSARVLSRHGDKVIVEQLGAARFLFFNRDIRLVVQVHEQPPDRIDVSLVDGDMKVYDCHWELMALDGGGTRVRYRASIAPKFYVPGIVGTSLVRKDIARMMGAVLSRMDRQ